MRENAAKTIKRRDLEGLLMKYNDTTDALSKLVKDHMAQKDLSINISKSNTMNSTMS